ncbi:hypothetical protein NRS6186_10310 [Bacillus subtilis]|uniref:hypothetical protein n=1 Tax=Bacillus TaxID=1386 RepID=UPI0004A25DF4|nr:hypothetical protein [Bacillus subtilis]MBU8842862.1 hypothetical protein [Alkalicoccobacillus gibsonii]WIT27297.1 hypothetical protein [Bacillus phage SPbetaL3]AOA54790.1 hypothetical protein BSHJ0_02219 [Bacillus subtilis]AWM21133.1 hypothetical protein DJ572_10080 [Bacillus subtilis]AXP48592.1 hypothetical protein DYS67_10235 [Bacillus subtilis subsp. subtilis]
MEIISFKFEDSSFEIHVRYSASGFKQDDRDIISHVRELSISILKAATGLRYFLKGNTYIKHEEDNSVYCSFDLD